MKRMGAGTDHRPRLLSDDLGRDLAAYLAFRHHYRHSYSFTIDWTEMSQLVLSLDRVWNQLKRELALFMDSIEKA
jgi:hypothetical protein